MLQDVVCYDNVVRVVLKVSILDIKFQISLFI